jgi:2-polyprenyl-6-methoxyphenol hydroxylase-like FAD-dependent oxidoreductase
VLRRALEAQANVQVLEGHHVVALLGTGRRVTGVRTAGADGSGDSVAADLVVDASGRGSRLEYSARCPAGGISVDATVVDPERYVSRWFELAPYDAPDWHCWSRRRAAPFAPP